MMTVTIPTLLSEYGIPKRYTCDGQDLSLPAQWSAVPLGTVELAIFVVNLLPIHGKLFFEWGVAGLSPQLHGLSAGMLPPGAIVGRNNFGNTRYSLCPPKGAGPEHFFLKVAALPKSLGATAGFDVEALYRKAERSAIVVGLAGGVYPLSGA
jgi:phosphatidylethanolamine-binding protein (PEBP) family uncharacterized protein